MSCFGYVEGTICAVARHWEGFGNVRVAYQDHHNINLVFKITV